MISSGQEWTRTTVSGSSGQHYTILVTCPEPGRGIGLCLCVEFAVSYRSLTARGRAMLPEYSSDTRDSLSLFLDPT